MTPRIRPFASLVASAPDAEAFAANPYGHKRGKHQHDVSHHREHSHEVQPVRKWEAHLRERLKRSRHGGVAN